VKVSEIMTKKILTISLDTPVYKIAEVLYKNGFTGLPIIERDKVVGIVTEADLVMQNAKIHMPTYIQLLDSFLYLESPGHLEKELHKILGTKASEIMTGKVITINPESSIEDLATLITDNHINPVPVVKNNKLVGIVSRADLVRLLMKGKKVKKKGR
jgi:CBS domain-containing protein